MSRGALTDAAKQVSKGRLGYEITIKELRLMPYIQYVMMNDQRLDPNKINSVERDVIHKWKDAGYMEGGMTGLTITKEFWDAMNEILFISYVSRS